jgi:uncharacterized membrane protein
MWQSDKKHRPLSGPPSERREERGGGMVKKNDDPTFADRVERFCSSSTRAILAVFLLGLLVFELTRFAYWLVAR